MFFCGNSDCLATPVGLSANTSSDLKEKIGM